jgi:hypothetical protein
MPVGGVRTTLSTVDCVDADAPQAGAAAVGVPKLPAELADTGDVVAGSLSRSDVAATDTAATVVPARQATPARAKGSDAEASTAPRLMPAPATTNVSETMTPAAPAGAPTEAEAVRVAVGWLGTTCFVSVGVMVVEAVTGLGLTVAAVDADGVPDAATDSEALDDGDADSDALLDVVADDDVLGDGARVTERLAARLRDGGAALRDRDLDADGLAGVFDGDGARLADTDELPGREAAPRLADALRVTDREAAAPARDALTDRDGTAPPLRERDTDGERVAVPHASDCSGNSCHMAAVSVKLANVLLDASSTLSTCPAVRVLYPPSLRLATATCDSTVLAPRSMRKKSCVLPGSVLR